jgi:predicted HicB family RNase H-like nuclease
MEKKSLLGDVFMMGVEGECYRELLDIAKKQGKTVNEVASDALRKEIEKSKGLSESSEKRLLVEG